MQEMKSLEEIKKFLQENKEIILKEFKAEIVGILGLMHEVNKRKRAILI